jgi:hypothetical protein
VIAGFDPREPEQDRDDRDDHRGDGTMDEETGHGRRIAALLVAIGLLPVGIVAEGGQSEPSDARQTGLPPGVTWTFSFDATWGTFGFANSLFENPKEDVPENLSDQWFEGSVKPKLSAVFRSGSSSEIYGAISAVGERTYGSAPELVGADFSSFQAEDLAIGWRSGTSGDPEARGVDVTVGRAQYRLGQGFLLWDGAAEGGSRGGYWTNVRRAFEFAAIARVRPGPHTVEGFYLDKDDLPEHDTGTRLWGANYEFAQDDSTTLGVTWLSLVANPEVLPERDGLGVVNLRAYTAPFPSLSELSFQFEYAIEQNGDLLRSSAWTLQGAYDLGSQAWAPTVSYRYAFFEGDDPETPRNEAFDPLLVGFFDWGYWWQGEIVGEYAVSNSNLVSHMVRAHVAPRDTLEGGLIWYKFFLDQPASFGPGVTDPDLALEIDAYVDWQINDNFSASFVAAWADPGAAARQAFDRTKNFMYGMVFVGYSY